MKEACSADAVANVHGDARCNERADGTGAWVVSTGRIDIAEAAGQIVQSERRRDA